MRSVLTLALAPLTVAAIVKEKSITANLGHADIVRRGPEFLRVVDAAGSSEDYTKEALQDSRGPSEKTLQWAARNGATVSDSLTVSSVGLTIKQETMPGTVLLSVPASLSIQSVNASKSQLRQIFQEHNVPVAALSAESHELRLAAALLVLAKSGQDKLGGYISSLPTADQNRDHNMFMAETGLLVSFQDLPIAETVRQYQLASKKRLDQFTAMGGQAESNDWDWADSLVRTKAFRQPHGGLMLVPTADLVGTTMDASRQNIEINIGDPTNGEPVQVIAKQHLYPGMELLAPLRGTESMREQTVSLRGDASACSRLSQSVTNIMKGYNASGDCVGHPAQVPQKAAFCSLAGMAAMGCSECSAFPCKDNACTCGATGFFVKFFSTFRFDFWGAHAERPILVSFCVLAGIILVVIRGFRLLDATKSRSDRDRSYHSQSSSASVKSSDSDGSKKSKKNVKFVKNDGGGLNLHGAY